MVLFYFTVAEVNDEKSDEKENEDSRWNDTWFHGLNLVNKMY